MYILAHPNQLVRKIAFYARLVVVFPKGVKMKITDKIIKPLEEAKYLNVDNTDRYRAIMRLFFFNYERLKYWMDQEEIYSELIEDPYFSQYTIEQCQQDLTALTNWGNLFTIQDTKKANTLEEFKNKKFRYQLSETAVEIERMIVRLENLSIEGSSLEPSLLERIKNSIYRMEELHIVSDEEIYSWWKDLNSDFVRLNQDYQDYMRTLNSVKAEEMMKSQQFLIFKDQLMEYLRNFVKRVQITAPVIEHYLKNLEHEKLENILHRVVICILAVPQVEVEMTEEEMKENVEGRFTSIVNWFVGKNGREPEVNSVLDTTNEIIRKITRYATRLSERSNHAANRREEYKKVATIFSKCKDMKEAHCMAACVFGIEKPLHLKGQMFRKTESMNIGVYEEEPAVVQIKPRVRNYRERAKRTGIVDRTAEKEATRLATIRKIEEERKILESYIKDNKIVFSELPVLSPEIRDTFLKWLSKALEKKEWKAKTEDGRKYYIHEEKGKRCVVECTDGCFTMPQYTICFEEESQ